jgi:hypothetical protein
MSFIALFDKSFADTPVKMTPGVDDEEFLAHDEGLRSILTKGEWNPYFMAMIFISQYVGVPYLEAERVPLLSPGLLLDE